MKKELKTENSKLESTIDKQETQPDDLNIPIDLGIPIDDEEDEETLQTGQVSAAFGGPTPSKRSKLSLDTLVESSEEEDNEEPSTFAQTLQSRFNNNTSNSNLTKTSSILKQPFLKQSSHHSSSLHKQSSSHSSSSLSRRDPRGNKPVSRSNPTSINVPISNLSNKVAVKPGSANNDPTILKLKYIAKQFYDSIMKCDPAWRRFDSVKGIKAIYKMVRKYK